MAFEKTPSPAMPVHGHLLVESGIHIIEVLNLEELARDGVLRICVCGRADEHPRSHRRARPAASVSTVDSLKLRKFLSDPIL